MSEDAFAKDLYTPEEYMAWDSMVDIDEECERKSMSSKIIEYVGYC